MNFKNVHEQRRINLVAIVTMTNERYMHIKVYTIHVRTCIMYIEKLLEIQNVLIQNVKKLTKNEHKKSNTLVINYTHTQRVRMHWS